MTIPLSWSKIRAIVVDDEALARASVTGLLAQDSDVEVVQECENGVDAIAAIRSLRPDLLILDVQMPGLDGFDVLEQLGSATPKSIIFITAYQQYALKAFDAQAIDYLLKPFSDSRFHRALSRAKALISEGEDQPRRFVVKSRGHALFLPIDEIDWISAADYYACLHVGEKEHLLRRSISDLEDDLAADAFCRIHRSAIVNIDRVRELTSDSNGDSEVVLRDKTRLRVSRAYREQLLLRLGARV